MRFGIVISWTRCLIGIDYDTGLFSIFLGPFTFCAAWGAKENNPFISQEELDEEIRRDPRRK